VVLEVFFASPTAPRRGHDGAHKAAATATGAVLEKSFRATEKFAEPDVELVPRRRFFTSDARTAFISWTRKDYEQFTFSRKQSTAIAAFLRKEFRSRY